MSLGVVFEESKAGCHPQFTLSAFCFRFKMWAPSCRAYCQASLSWWWQTCSSGTVSPNASFYKLPQSWYFSTPIENEVIYPVCHLYPGKLWEIPLPWLWASISETVKQITNAPTHDMMVEAWEGLQCTWYIGNTENFILVSSALHSRQLFKYTDFLLLLGRCWGWDPGLSICPVVELLP